MRKTSLVAFAITILWSVSAFADPPLLPVQGRLLDSGGAPVTETTQVTFAFYSAGSGGSPVFSIEDQWVSFSDGYFVAYLEVNPDYFADAPELWLGVTIIGDSEMTPRVQLGAAPSAAFAHSCGDAATLGELGPSAFATANHPHSGYAATSHGHSGYADDSHLHGGVYAPNSHPHAGFADAVHTHGGATIVDDSLTASDLADGTIPASKLAESYSLDGHDHDADYAPAGPATDVSCSGCVSNSELNLDLSFYLVTANASTPVNCTGDIFAPFCALKRVDLNAKCNLESPLLGKWRLCAESGGGNTVSCGATCIK